MLLGEAINSAIQQLEFDADGNITASLRFDSDNTAFAGHFPENPILPGFCQIEAVRLLLERAWPGSQYSIKAMKAAKYYSPVMPGDEIVYKLQILDKSDESVKLKVQVFCDEQKKSEIKITCGKK